MKGEESHIIKVTVKNFGRALRKKAKHLSLKHFEVKQIQVNHEVAFKVKKTKLVLQESDS